jgi:hypothetical protein
MYLVLDVQLLDCWRYDHGSLLIVHGLFLSRAHFKCTDIFEYFKTLDSKNCLPDIEELVSAA